MDIFKVGPFEVGINLELATEESIQGLFRELRDCPDCSRHKEAIGTLEREVWKRYFGRGK